MYFRRTHRKELIALNLTALIDICAILIIFLVLGTVFGESGISLPKNLRIPQSSNTAQVQNAPIVTIVGQTVTLSIDTQKVSLEEYRPGAESDSLAIQRQSIREYLNGLPADIKKSGYLLNIVADSSTSYRDIFDVLRFYRDSGFQSILFLATGD